MVDASAASGAAKWIASALIEEGKYLYGVEDQLWRLQRDLEYMKVFLLSIDVNPHRLKEDGTLRILIQDIRELAFRAEDVVDTYIVDVRSRVFRENLFSKLACLVSNCYPVHMSRNEIEDIQKDLKDAMARSKDFGAIIPTTSRQRRNDPRCIPEDYIHLDDDVVVGIDDAISQFVERLTDPKDDFKALAIVGTGGGGKTTLATQLYRHSKVASWFSHKVFVSISQQWSRGDLLIRIFKQVKGEDCEIPSSETEIVRELHEFLKDKQCVIVLDDMWEKEAWDDISPIFSHSNKGCRFLLTTRIKEVALYIDNECVIHEPKLLSEEQKWELFRKVAMVGRANIEGNDAFEKLGKQMLEKCVGLPLAVVTLAGILRTKQEIDEWEEISSACNENILKGKGRNYGVVEDMLELSYLDLPAYLKPCFLYLACFPEDWDIKAHMLIEMWIAEGFITDDLRKGKGTLEDAGMRLLKELAQRCIIRVTQENVMGQIESIRMHDLMREFCIKYAKDSRFFGTISSPYDANVGAQNQPRRIAIHSRGDYAVENNHVRTLVHFVARADTEVENSIWRLHKFKLLRVLCLESTMDMYGGTTKKVTLPEQIGKLIHLRSLLLGINIRELPKSIRNLRNLLYLECRGEQLIVPNNLVWNMENLRGLVLLNVTEHDFNLKSLGLKSDSRHLQSLSSSAGKWVTKDIPTLSPTVRNLSIYHILKMEEMEAIYRCPSIVGDSLSTLWLLGSVEFDLQEVRHCTTLQSLGLICPMSINSAMGTVQYFPPNLVKLFLRKSRIERDDLLQVIGELPKLKSLSLVAEAYLGKQLSCSAGNAFPQLEKLKLGFLDNLEEWRMEEGAMPRLRMIEIISCKKLERLPESIRSITTLKELHISLMPKEFCTRLGYGESSAGGEDSDLIRHIPTVKFG